VTDDSSAEAFIRAHTRLGRGPLVPEFKLYLASEITPIWQASEDFLTAHNIAPPFWAFAWPGSQALARYIVDSPELVAGKRVLDFAAGCGLAAMAAVRAGAASVQAVEIDALAVAAMRLNFAENGMVAEAVCRDVVGDECAWDVIVSGDIFYEAPMTRHVLPWLRTMAASGCEVWVADPGRAYVPRQGMQLLHRYVVPTTAELEDRDERDTSVFRLV